MVVDSSVKSFRREKVLRKHTSSSWLPGKEDPKFCGGIVDEIKNLFT